MQPLFGAIDARVAANLAKVQAAFKQHRIGPHHFQGSTGYGHGDLGREALDNVSSQCGEKGKGVIHQPWAAACSLTLIAAPCAEVSAPNACCLWGCAAAGEKCVECHPRASWVAAAAGRNSVRC